MYYIYNLFITIAIKHGISGALLLGLCSTESDFKIRAINLDDGNRGSHSFGICQIQYATAKDMGFVSDSRCSRAPYTSCPLVTDPKINIEYAARYLTKQLIRYNLNTKKAVSAYNAGTAISGNRRYVDKVLTRTKEWMTYGKTKNPL